MGSYRDRLDIIADILQVVSQKAKKTQIMYRANLSYNVLQRYLRSITAAFFIDFEAAEKYYVLTSKGKDFLQTYQAYVNTKKSTEEQLKKVDSKRKTLEELCSNK